MPSGYDAAVGAFPDSLTPDANDRVYVGGVLTRATLVEAYTRGIFPWRGGEQIPWYCPDPRAVLRAGHMHVTHSLAKRARNGRFTVAFDHDFRGAMLRCAHTPRGGEPETWITPDMLAAYGALHDEGIAHSLEIYQSGQPVGGLYGLTFGRIFHGESMYHLVADSSKLALWAMSDALAAHGVELIDCQVPTAHMLRLGAERWPRARYLARLAENSTQSSLHHSWHDWRVESLPTF